MSSDPQQPIVSILVVAYNSREFISPCLESIPQACAAHAYEVLLIDNGGDDTAEFVRERFPSVRIVPSQGNVGYGLGNNLLAAQAHPSSDFLLVLNPDTEVCPDAIDKLITAARNHPEFGALSGAPKSEFDTDNSLPLVALPSLKGLLYSTFGLAHRNARKKLPKNMTSEVFETEVLSGFFLLIRRSLWERVGGYDESFFLYGEDTDLCKRLAQAGAKLGLVMSSQVNHDTGSGARFSAQRQHFKMLGTAHYANKHFGPVKRTAFKVTMWLQCLTKYTASSLLKGRGERMASMAEAFRGPARNPWLWYYGYSAKGADPRRSDA